MIVTQQHLPSSCVRPWSASLALGVAFALAFAPVAAANSSGAPVARANDPPLNANCTGCHVGPLNPAVMLGLVDATTMMPITQYVPGQTETLGFLIQSALGLRWGFEAIPLTTANLMAGAFPAPINANYQVRPNGARQYVTHTAIGTAAGMAGGNGWQVSWIAPPTDVGDVTFYVCGNAANNSATSAGDAINCTTFTLTTAAPADSDGDTLPDSVELTIGTNPNDADTDDDGVRDGAETAGDSDMDAVIDALECDSDGDTLPDGLEVGITAPDPDTNPGAGCFIADVDPGSTTDSTDPNTDGDGDLANPCTDGDEDANRNGQVDLPSETDPNDGLDCPAPTGATSRLRWSRANNLLPIPNPLHFAAVPTCTTSSDIVICAEAPMAVDRDDVPLPQQVAGSPGVIVFIQYDSDLAAPGTLDLIRVVKDPLSPGNVIVR